MPFTAIKSFMGYFSIRVHYFQEICDDQPGSAEQSPGIGLVPVT
jgi:hypothetical protein